MIAEPLWKHYDKENIGSLDFDDFYLILNDMMGVLSEKY